jgi:hypothetical protein
MVDPTAASAQPAPASEFRDTPEFKRSREIRNGADDYTAADALKLAKALRNQLALGESRRLVEHVREQRKNSLTAGDDFELLRIQVTCTYKDAELPPELAFTRALQLLKEAGYDPESTTNSEVLGLAGAVWKRWWDYDGQRNRLIRSLTYYERGFNGKVTTDEGYQAINAAYVLDLLASLEMGKDGATSDAQSAAGRLQAATAIREKLIAADKENPPANAAASYWYLATIGEAYLGLHQMPEAEQRLRAALSLESAEPWMRESTARQLAGMVVAHHVAHGNTGPVEESPLWGVVQRAFGAPLAEGVHSALIGKVGLALSGGGFRAALYHIGVLARLAELDVLRRVEVLSCVSGGSIVGARYYLEVRRLLQRHPDADIKREDYIEIVSRMEQDFLAGVQTDLRNSLLADREANLRSADDLAYSRTTRLGELYEERLFATVPDDEGDAARYISHLYIEPPDHGDQKRPFNPRLENWRRKAKVPLLVLNATALNTGHSWQFTASWMGETLGSFDPKINSTPPLRRMRYSEAPAPHGRVRLGDAVAASACVPGIFDPVVFSGLYGDGLALRLVDGGAFDNQGIASLLEENCSVLLVSDASGQILLDGNPGANPLSVSQRANDILMARVRETQYQLLSRLRSSGVLRGLMYIHLRDGLSAPPINWIGCTDPPDPATVPKPTLLTGYSIRTDVQRGLAELRTDLDAFSELEAKALMESGYRAASWHLREDAREVPAALVPAADEAGAEPWQFHAVVPLVASITQSVELSNQVVAHLRRGSQVAGRTLPLLPDLKGLKWWTLGAAIAVAILYCLGFALAPRWTLAVVVVAFLTGLGVGVFLVKKLGVSGDLNATWQKASGRLIGWVGFKRARQQLEVGTPQYLEEGSLQRFQGKARSGD